MSSDSAPFVSTVYGPVPSWRFGRSLGIDPIVEASTCSFNCIYCQLGAIQRVTAMRRVFVAAERVAADLAGVDWSGVDVVTISGSGEPTLAANLDAIVAAIRAATDRPLHLLTNATLLGDPAVRRAVGLMDVVACKLDAPDDAELRRVNRPAPGITVESVVRGIEQLRGEFPGRLVLQTMLMPANVDRVDAWAPLVARIRPDEIHLNTPRRPYPDRWYVESRGDHAAEIQGVGRTRLRVVSPEQARAAEARLRELTGLPIVSVYREN